jgi:hypothetical protein
MFDVVNGVQDSKEIRICAFERAEQLSKQLTALLKGNEQLPRYILLQLSQAANILEYQASYMRTTSDKQETFRMANAIKLTFDLILRGECHDDRRPGIPRIG